MTFFVALLWVGLGLDTFPLGTLAAEWPAWDRAVAVNYSLSIGVLLVAFAALFPDGRFVPRWMRWAVAVAAAEEFVRLAFPSSPLSPSSRPEELQLLENAGWIVLMVGAQVYRYRRVSGPVQRQQTKWVVFAFAFALGLNVAVGLLPLIAPVAGQEGSPAALALAAAVDASLILTPLAVGVAILRHRLFDVDLLINRALVYGGLSASLALVYVASVVSLQAVFAA